jgi:hypothetical protein
MLQKIDAYLKKDDRTDFYKVTYLHFFKHSLILSHSTFRVEADKT